jgi:hypothetical protein
MSGNSGGNARDNRQRGNAAQLHEKYKSMARDAQLAGDRVQTEYYLQFADHYFRMLGDARPRFDEQKRARDDDQDDDGDDRMDSEMDQDGDGDSDGDDGEQQQPSPQQQRRPRPVADRNTSDRAEPRRDRPVADRTVNDRLEPRRANGRARDDDNRGRGRDSVRDEEGERIDFAVLPPAIGTDNDDDDREPVRAVEAEQEAPRPRRRVRRPRDEDDATAV